jgi:hypothetical protein
MASRAIGAGEAGVKRSIETRTKEKLEGMAFARGWRAGWTAANQLKREAE